MDRNNGVLWHSLFGKVQNDILLKLNDAPRCDSWTETKTLTTLTTRQMHDVQTQCYKQVTDANNNAQYDSRHVTRHRVSKKIKQQTSLMSQGITRIRTDNTVWCLNKFLSITL